MKKLEIDALQIFKDLYIDDEIVKALLSGEKDEWVKYKDWEINHPEEIKEKTCIALMIFVLIFLKIKERNIPPIKWEIPPLFMYIYATIGCRVYEKVKSEYPDDYRAWRNYITDNILSIFDRKNANMQINIYGIIELGYKNYLENFFDVIYNKHYTNDYRKNITRSLKRKEFAAILPYYEEYCKENNISPDRYYYLGDIPEKHEESRRLSFIDSESPDKDTEQHFGLVLKSNQVEYLYNELKGTYLDASTDIRLFCYRLTGKGKPDKIEKLKWVSDDDSLAVFIRHLGVSKDKCWQKTESFFGNKNENLKSRYHRLTKQKGKLKVNDINLINLDNILASI